MNKDNIKLRIVITTGVMLMFIGITLLLNDYVKEKRDLVYNEMNISIMEISSDDIEEEVTDETSSSEQEEKVDSGNEDYESYVAKLNIPKINFSRGFYKKDSSLNDLRYSIKILSESDYPDVEKGNVILAGHSGNYTNSYFANLYKLELGDTATINYNNKDYTYKIVNIYYEDKDGTVSIYRNKEKSTLTLITCTKDDKEHQTIYILELI